MFMIIFSENPSIIQLCNIVTQQQCIDTQFNMGYIVVDLKPAFSSMMAYPQSGAVVIK